MNGNVEGVKCYLPKAAFYIMTELPVDDAYDFCKWMLTDFQLDGRTVMLAPGNGFYLNEHIGKKQVRIAFVLGQPELSNALDCLEKGIKQYQDQRVLSHSIPLNPV